MLFKEKELLIFFFASLANLAFGGTPCPPFTDIHPCYCSISGNDETIVTCAGLRNSTELAVATHSMKSMIVDRLMLLGSFRKQDDIGLNTIEDDDDDVNSGDRLPKTWLGSLRVRELEIQDVKLSNCYLCNEPLESQDDFLVSLVVTHSSLKGTLCSSCSTKTKSVYTKHLQKLRTLKVVDFSNNALEVIAENAFPNTMRLSKVVLAHNMITKIYNNAFSNLGQLKELDLSHNMLTSVNSKMFRPNGSLLNSLDLSWNSIQALPEDMFTGMQVLKEIKLNHNLIEVLSDNTMARLPIQMEKLDLKGNFLVCNCSMSWVKKKLPKNTKLTGKCVYPKEAEFQDIKPTLSILQSCR